MVTMPPLHRRTGTSCTLQKTPGSRRIAVDRTGATSIAVELEDLVPHFRTARSATCDAPRSAALVAMQHDMVWRYAVVRIEIRAGAIAVHENTSGTSDGPSSNTAM